MIRVLIGHRGTGKSAILRRIAAYYDQRGRAVECYDLDDIIAAQEAKSIPDLFTEKGEAYFRRVELEIFRELWDQVQNANGDVYIALGAGFSGSVPEAAEVIWIRRATDLAGRIFFDRPLLNPQLKPLADYLARVGEREAKYELLADEQITLPEGFTETNSWEPILLGLDAGSVGGLVTVFPQEKWSRFFNRRRNWGVGGFELRSDLLTMDDLDAARVELSPSEIVFSQRSPSPPPEWANDVRWDWPLEYGARSGMEAPILSLHERLVDLPSTLQQLPDSKSAHIKLAVTVDTLQELLLGHQWWLRDPENRSFLPRSKDGRWSWYRQLFGPRMKMGFWREGSGSAPDQPLIADWIRTQSPFNFFAAVLGDPVEHSYTPSEQSEFFLERQMPVVRIRLSENEFSAEGLTVLRELGLRAAAVTSPLKFKALEFSKEHSSEAVTARAVNTLVWDGLLEFFKGHNTDLAGLTELLSGIPVDQDKVAVWGGGGTREAVRSILPEAQFCSVRGRCLESGEDLTSIQPAVVVWAISNQRSARLALPPQDWRPQLVVDLNYTEDSRGREFAKIVGASYISGMEMFLTQAKGQREYWQEQLRLT